MVLSIDAAVQMHIGVSSNGRTSGFGPEYRGSSPCTPAIGRPQTRECLRPLPLLGVQGLERRSREPSGPASRGREYLDFCERLEQKA